MYSPLPWLVLFFILLLPFFLSHLSFHFPLFTSTPIHLLYPPLILLHECISSWQSSASLSTIPLWHGFSLFSHNKFLTLLQFFHIIPFKTLNPPMARSFSHYHLDLFCVTLHHFFLYLPDSFHTCLFLTCLHSSPSLFFTKKLFQILFSSFSWSGSVMACEGSTWIIDPEFAFYGPMYVIV